MKKQWVSRLLTIHERARTAAAVIDDLKQAASVACLLQELLENVLRLGAWPTLRGHVRA